MTAINAKCPILYISVDEIHKIYSIQDKVGKKREEEDESTPYPTPPLRREGATQLRTLRGEEYLFSDTKAVKFCPDLNNWTWLAPPPLRIREAVAIRVLTSESDLVIPT